MFWWREKGRLCVLGKDELLDLSSHRTVYFCVYFWSSELLKRKWRGNSSKSVCLFFVASERHPFAPHQISAHIWLNENRPIIMLYGGVSCSMHLKNRCVRHLCSSAIQCNGLSCPSETSTHASRRCTDGTCLLNVLVLILRHRNCTVHVPFAINSKKSVRLKSQIRLHPFVGGFKRSSFPQSLLFVIS